MIQITDISFPRNSVGSLNPLKTLWRSTMGVQPPSTLPTHGMSEITTEVVFQSRALTASITRAVSSTRITVTTVTSHGNCNTGY